MELYYLMDRDDYYRSAIPINGIMWDSRNIKERDAVIYTPIQLYHAKAYYKRRRILVREVLVEREPKAPRKPREKKQKETI
jgi:hypothetical protein